MARKKEKKSLPTCTDWLRLIHWHGDIIQLWLAVVKTSKVMTLSLVIEMNFRAVHAKIPE